MNFKNCIRNKDVMHLQYAFAYTIQIRAFTDYSLHSRRASKYMIIKTQQRHHPCIIAYANHARIRQWQRDYKHNDSELDLKEPKKSNITKSGPVARPKIPNNFLKSTMMT